MGKHRLVVTDLTEYGDLRCVAGWDIDRKKMIRPEPHAAGFWGQAFCGKGKPFEPGNIVIFDGDSPVPQTDLPHRREDIVVRGEVTLEKGLSSNEFIAALKAMGGVGPSDAFAAPVEISNGKAYVPRGTDHPSLRGLTIGAGGIRFGQQKFGEKPPKPRVYIDVPGGPAVNLSIAGAELRDVFEANGVAGLEEMFKGNQNLHVRLGLARGFGPFPDRCYMQVNGIYRLG